MPDSEQELDAALAEFTKDTSEPEAQKTEGETQVEGTPTQTDEGQSQAVQWPVTVAGRTYKSPEELVKSHDNLYRLKSRLEQETKQEREWSKPWRAYEKALREDPELYKWLKSAESKYRESRASGASPAQAKAQGVASGVPKEIMEKIQKHESVIKEVEAQREEQRLDRELSDVRSKFKLDDATMEKVTGIMLDVAKKTGLEIDAEEAYWRYQAIANRDQLAVKTKELERTRADASVSPAGVSQRPQSKAPAAGSDADYNASLNKWADSIGLRD